MHSYHYVQAFRSQRYRPPVRVRVTQSQVSAKASQPRVRVRRQSEQRPVQAT